MKIGILGGSFDPIHNGHIYMAIKAFEALKLDEVWLLPAGHSPNKKETNMVSFSDRFKMCQLAAKSYSFLKVSDFEGRLNNTTYTYITLTRLKEMYPNHDFFFIMGADSLDYFEQWRHPDIIAKLAKLVVVNRDEFSIEALNQKKCELGKLFPVDIQILSCSKIDIASSQVKELLHHRQDVSEFLNSEVLEYITQHHLYE